MGNFLITKFGQETLSLFINDILVLFDDVNEPPGLAVVEVGGQILNDPHKTQAVVCRVLLQLQDPTGDFLLCH